MRSEWPGHTCDQYQYEESDSVKKVGAHVDSAPQGGGKLVKLMKKLFASQLDLVI